MFSCLLILWKESPNHEVADIFPEGSLASALMGKKLSICYDELYYHKQWLLGNNNHFAWPQDNQKHWEIVDIFNKIKFMKTDMKANIMSS